jgi:hypothetical protein
MSYVEGAVESVYINGTADISNDYPRREIQISLEGIVGDKHAGFVKSADVRDSPIPKRVDDQRVIVRNWRQWSAVSIEELILLARRLRTGVIRSALLGANLSVSGINRFSQIPRGSTLWFPGDAVLMVEEENMPCVYPGKEIAKIYPQVEPSLFVKNAMGLRGLVGVVQRAGVIGEKDNVRVILYKPKTYLIRRVSG